MASTHPTDTSRPPAEQGLKSELQDAIRRLRDDPDQRTPFLILVGLVAVLVWSYWNTLTFTASFWDDPLYSHGYLVPLFTLALLWMRREPFQPVGTWDRWLGLGLLAGSLALRMVATHYAMVTIDAFTLVPALAGVFLLVGGLKMLRWAGPAIVFLMFMFPLPTVLKENILGNLQRVATIASTFLMQTFGIAAIREGNRISIDNDLQLGVVDACSGLRMATIFLALAVAIVLVVRRPWWDRLIILLSAIPIALIVNVIRVTVTGVLYMLARNSELAQKVFHDWAGWFMMPLALGLLYLELQILSALVIEDSAPELATVRVRSGGGGDKGLRPPPVRPS
jgi:exosortase